MASPAGAGWVRASWRASQWVAGWAQGMAKLALEMVCCTACVPKGGSPGKSHAGGQLCCRNKSCCRLHTHAPPFACNGHSARFLPVAEEKERNTPVGPVRGDLGQARKGSAHVKLALHPHSILVGAHTLRVASMVECKHQAACSWKAGRPA